MAIDWTELPPDLVETISKNLKIYADYFNFRIVCRTWLSAIPRTPHHLPPQLPWLMLPQSQSYRAHRAFFNLSTNRFHFLNLPEASHRKRHCGSSNGWLILLDDTPSILLINPLTRAKLYLPCLSSFPPVISFNYSDIGREYVLRNASGGRSVRNLRQMRDSFIKKVVLSSSPSKDSNFMVMAILNETGDLAYCRNGDQSWRIIENGRSFSEDVIYMDGLFYAVNKVGQIAVCDVNYDLARVWFINTPSQIGGDMQYLVNSGDELLLVTRYMDLYSETDPTDVVPQHLIYRTVRFEVFKLESNGPQWVRERSLGDKALFLGENTSLCLSSVDFPGCSGNCIYFTDDYYDTDYDGHLGEHDSGIFKLWDGSIEPLACYPRTIDSRLQWPPPVWVSPGL